MTDFPFHTPAELLTALRELRDPLAEVSRRQMARVRGESAQRESRPRWEASLMGPPAITLPDVYNVKDRQPDRRRTTMGNWNITIRGQGAHHNKNNTGDANRLAAQFVKRLKEAGAGIISASITYGSDEGLEDPDKYLADRDLIEADKDPAG